MEKVGYFLGRLAAAAAYIALACIFGGLQPVFGILFCVGMLFCAIATNLMVDNSGTGRIVVFYIAMALLIIPAFVQTVMVMVAREGSSIQVGFFAVCVVTVFTSWLECGRGEEGLMTIFDFGVPFYGWLISLAVKALFKAYAATIIFLVASIIVLLVMLIMRIKKGSALGW